MTTALILLGVQGLLGAFDTLYYHEWRLQLPAQPFARRELLLHAGRDFAYAVLFGTIGWVTWNGLFAWILAALLVVEIVLTLCDFVEEDRTRRLPPGERVMHAVMGILYGLFLANLTPHLLRWATLPTGFGSASHGWLAWALTACAAGVLLSGLRDAASALQRSRQPT